MFKNYLVQAWITNVSCMILGFEEFLKTDKTRPMSMGSDRRLSVLYQSSKADSKSQMTQQNLNSLKDTENNSQNLLGNRNLTKRKRRKSSHLRPVTGKENMNWRYYFSFR